MHLVYFLIGKSDALCNRPYGTYPPGFGYTSARTRNLIILAVSIEADKAGVPFPDDLFVEYFEPSEDDKSIDGLCRSLDHAGTVA